MRCTLPCRASGLGALGGLLAAVVLPAGLLAALALQAAGCAFEPGLPWAEVTPTLDVRFHPPAERRDDAGRLLTDEGYAVAIDAVEVLVLTASVSWSPDAAAGERPSSATFDPSDPPEGYTDCHSGHCHSVDSGDVVSFADIEAELAAAVAPVSGTEHVVRVADTPTVLDGALATPVPLDPCGDACLIDQPAGALLSMAALIEEVHIEGRVFDASGAGRLGAADGVRFEGTWEIDADSSAPIPDAVFGGSAPPGLDVAGTLDLPAGLLDGVAFDAVLGASSDGGSAVRSLTDSEPVGSAIVSAVREHATLTVTVSRRSL